MKIQPVGNSDRFGWKEASLDATEEGRPLYKKNRDLKIRLRNTSQMFVDGAMTGVSAVT